MKPENLKSGDTDSGANPTWYEGNGWSFRPRGNRGNVKDASITLYAEGHDNVEGRAFKLELTDRQIAELLYAGQMGYFTPYGGGND